MSEINGSAALRRDDAPNVPSPEALDPTATEAIRKVAQFLDQCGFNHANTPAVLGSENVLFPEFEQLQRALSVASRFHRFLFSIFRQGHAAAELHVRGYLPPDVLSACLEAGLLVQDWWADYRTPDVGIVAVHGLKLVASLPSMYRTASGRSQVAHVGVDTLLRLESLPRSLRGQRVLDLSASAGAMGLMCALRGAGEITIVESSSAAEKVTRFNAVLNGLEQVVEVRGVEQEPGQRGFDYFVAELPLIPRPSEASALFGESGCDGLGRFPAFLAEVTSAMSNGLHGLLFCEALGDGHQIFANRELKRHAQENGYQVQAFVQAKTPARQYAEQYLDTKVRQACGSLTQARSREIAASWLKAVKASNGENIYTQLLSFQGPTERPGLTHVPFYEATNTDPLISLVTRHRTLA